VAPLASDGDTCQRPANSVGHQDVASSARDAGARSEGDDHRGGKADDRDGDHYALDPHDAEADLWAFRLGLKRPKVASLRVIRPEVEQRPPPSPERPLSVADLEEAWTREALSDEPRSLGKP
jgi:hypothetical protein